MKIAKILLAGFALLCLTVTGNQAKAQNRYQFGEMPEGGYGLTTPSFANGTPPKVPSGIRRQFRLYLSQARSRQDSLSVGNYFAGKQLKEAAQLFGVGTLTAIAGGFMLSAGNVKGQGIYAAYGIGCFLISGVCYWSAVIKIGSSGKMLQVSSGGVALRF